MRIVSLLASTTEIVAALGRFDDLVGRSHECDFPPEVKHLPQVTRPVIDITAKSVDIDRDVKRLLADALSVYEVDADALKALRPDVILTQTQCEVCAVTPADVEHAVGDWLETNTQLVAVHPQGLDGIWQDIRLVAKAIGAERAADSLIERCQSRMTAIADDGARRPDSPSVACIEWIEPLMAAGDWIPDLVRMAGGRDVLAESGHAGQWFEMAQLAATDPQVILVMPCGFDLARTRAEMTPLTGADGWAGLRAVAEGRVYLTDGNQYFNRPGPRIVDSLEILAETLHPDCFHFGHQGPGWQRLL